MLLIVAALQQELGVALQLCRRPARLGVPGISAWEACHGELACRFLKTGVGPLRAERQIRALLNAFRPSRILVVGYGGALDPSLRVGDIVAVRRALLLKGHTAAPLQNVPLEGTWPLDGAGLLSEVAAAAGVRAVAGDVLTSPHIIGEPAQKKALFAAHGAAVIDMETAAVARAASPLGIPVACVRVISDEADDEFLAPFSYNANQGTVGRAMGVLRAGNWVNRYRDWRENSACARGVLGKFMAAWFEGAAVTAAPRSG